MKVASFLQDRYSRSLLPRFENGHPKPTANSSSYLLPFDTALIYLGIRVWEHLPPAAVPHSTSPLLQCSAIPLSLSTVPASACVGAAGHYMG